MHYYVFKINTPDPFTRQGLLQAAAKTLREAFEFATFVYTKDGPQVGGAFSALSTEEIEALCNNQKETDTYLVMQCESFLPDQGFKIENILIIHGKQSFTLRIKHFKNEFLSSEKKIGLAGSFFFGFSAISLAFIVLLISSGPVGWVVLGAAATAVCLAATLYCLRKYFTAISAHNKSSISEKIATLENVDYDNPPEWVISADRSFRSINVEEIKEKIQGEIKQFNSSPDQICVRLKNNTPSGQHIIIKPATTAKTKSYILFYRLPRNLHHPKLLNWIAVRVLNPDGYEYCLEGGNYAYPSLEAAKKVLLTTEEYKGASFGIVELNLACDAAQTIRDFLNKTLPFAAKTSIIEQAINGIYINDAFISIEHLDAKKQEEAHLKEIQYDPNDSNQLALSRPPLFCLAEIPQPLRFLCFIDYALFHRNKETWLHYDKREPGCVSDLFTTEVQINDGKVLSENKKTITFEHIIALHTSLSKNLFKKETASRSGKMRDVYNTFPVNCHTATKEGIVELLKRIKTDNDLNGFMLGKFFRTNMVAGFCRFLSTGLRDIMINNIGVSKNEKQTDYYSGVYKTLKENAIVAAMKDLQKQGINISSEDQEREIRKIIEVYIRDYSIEENMPAFDSWFFTYGSDFFKVQATKFTSSHTKEQLDFDMKYSRSVALARADNITDENIEECANEIWEVIQKGGDIHILTPEPELAKQWGQQALDNYNLAIQEAETIDDVITTIVILVHELELLHLFHDANCRTNYFLLNEQLNRYGVNRTILYDPNRLDLLSVAQIDEQVKQGIFRFLYVRENHKDLLHAYNTISHYHRDETNESVYAEISKPLEDRIISFNTAFIKKIEELRKFVPQVISLDDTNQEFYGQLCTLLDEFEKTKDILVFFGKVSDLVDNENIPKEIKEKFLESIQAMKSLTGYNETIASSLADANSHTKTLSLQRL